MTRSVPPDDDEQLAALYRDLAGHVPERDEIRIPLDELMVGGRFRVSRAASLAVGAATLSAAELLRARGTEPGRVAVDPVHAVVAFASERFLRVDGESGGLWAALSGDYRAADGWVRLHCNFRHHRDAALAALAVGRDRDAVAEAVSLRPALEVEEAVLARGGAAAAMRTAKEWRAHPAGRAVRELPLVAVDRIDGIGTAPPRPLPRADRPLSGVRVLDLTHVIAGPVCSRVLAAHGADVLRIGAAHLPPGGRLVVDTGMGKRSAFVDLREEPGRNTLRGLVAEADVLVQSYRPGSLAAKGFGPAELAALRPGIVVVTLSAYGRQGPWRRRRGFDSLVQMASGVADAGAGDAGADTPTPLPVQALDHGTGWLAAAGAMTALRRQATEGGSWLVELSLARTGAWLDRLGRLPDVATFRSALAEEDLSEFLAEVDGPFGRVTHVRVPGELPAAPPRWDQPAHRDGADPAEWW